MLKVNLQPKIAVEAREGVRLPYWLPVIIAIIVGILCGGTYWVGQQDLVYLDAEIKQQDFKLRDFQTIIADYEKAEMEKSYLQGKRDFVSGISKNQKQWTDFFDQMKETVPKDVWYTRFNAERDGEYNIEGKTFTYASVGFLMLQVSSISHVESTTLDAASSSSGGGGGGEGANLIDEIAKQFKLSGQMALKPAGEEQAEEGGNPAASDS